MFLYTSEGYYLVIASEFIYCLWCYNMHCMVDERDGGHVT